MATVVQLSLLLFCGGVFVIVSTNPIHSVLYLILTFLTTTLFFLTLKIEFLALLFIVIYVGAIAVLFLFVVMMLNIKITELNKKLTIFLPIGGLIMFIFFSEIYFVVICGHAPHYLIEHPKILLNFLLNTLKNLVIVPIEFFDYSINLDNFKDIAQIGFIMYTTYAYLLILSAMILLLAMLAAITLTEISFNFGKAQDYYKQTNSKTNTAIYFAK